MKNNNGLQVNEEQLLFPSLVSPCKPMFDKKKWEAEYRKKNKYEISIKNREYREKNREKFMQMRLDFYRFFVYVGDMNSSGAKIMKNLTAQIVRQTCLKTSLLTVQVCAVFFYRSYYVKRTNQR